MVVGTVLDNETLKLEISREKIDHRYSCQGTLYLLYFLF